MSYPKITVNTNQALIVIPSNTIPIPNPNLIAGIGTGDIVDSGTSTAIVSNKLTDSAATFSAANSPLPILIGDKVYNITTTANALVTAVDSGITLSLDGDIFLSTAQDYKIVRPDALVDNGINFVSLGVEVGDIVVNVDTAGIATVTVIVNEDELTLSADIFGTLATADDNFRIYSQSEGLERYPAYLGANGQGATSSNNPGCLIYVGHTGNVADIPGSYKDVVVRTTSGDIVTFYNFPVGDYLPIQVIQVLSSGTEADALIAIW